VGKLLPLCYIGRSWSTLEGKGQVSGVEDYPPKQRFCMIQNVIEDVAEVPCATPRSGNDLQ
jgi:hypothetical protein